MERLRYIMERVSASRDEATALRKVRGVAAEAGVPMGEVARTIGISRSALTRRYKSPSGDYTSVELTKLARRFAVPVTRFFPDDVAQHDRGDAA